MNTSLVIGASPNPLRFSHKMIESLVRNNRHVIALGKRTGLIEGIEIMKGEPALKNIHTVCLYINPENQEKAFPYILSLLPKRIIFNPGTENTKFMNLAREKGIEVIAACSLIMLSTGKY
ncbi:MAG: CoA-binding protein [Bacteroidales bacterium]|nr:CoA-binding protein [Bacteroidales bacterium]